jgi:hypothetical protein
LSADGRDGRQLEVVGDEQINFPGLFVFNPSFLQRRLKLPEIDFFGLIPAVFLCKSLIFNAGFSM